MMNNRSANSFFLRVIREGCSSSKPSKLRTIALRGFAFCACLIFASTLVSRNLVSSAAPNEQDQEQLLAPGISVEGEISPDQIKRFQVSISAGLYIHVIVEQFNIDLSVSLLAPDSKMIAEMDNPYGDRGTESISLKAEADGIYKIELFGKKNAPSSGRFRIHVEGPRIPTQVDQSRICGERVFIQAQKLAGDKSEEVRTQAIGKYQEALTCWHSAGDRSAEAQTLLRLGAVYYGLKNHAAALDSDSQSATLCHDIGDRRGEAYALRHLGYIHTVSNPSKSLAYLNQALELWQQTEGDKYNEAFILNNIGGAYENMGDAQMAMTYHQRSLAIRRELGDVVGVANVITNIGLLHDKLGDSQTALGLYRNAMDILDGVQPHDTRWRRTMAASLNNTGYVHLALGDYDIALNYCNQSLPLQRESGNTEGEISTLLNIGEAHLRLNDPQQALKNHETARSLALKIENDREEAYALMYKGEAYFSLGDRQQAMDQYFPALDAFRKTGDPEGEANTLNKIAAVFASQGNATKALDNYNHSLAIWRAIRDPRGEAATLYGIARIERARSNFEEAHTIADEAVKKVESLRANAVSRELRTSYLASVRDYYDLDIDLLMQLHWSQPTKGYDALALQLSERARARTLLESIAEVGKDIRQGVDRKLIEQEQLLQRQIEAKSQFQSQLLGQKKTEEQVAIVEKELSSLIEERKNVQEKIRAQSPRYAALIRPQPLNIEEIRQTLDPQTIMLEYALGQERSYLWLVTHSEIKCYELPSRAKIEAAAKQVYDLISSKEAIFAEAQAQYWKQAATLSRMILGRVASQLGNKRLLIVAEGALQYISFPALPVPTPYGRKAGSVIPMIVQNEISEFPSASVMAAMRREIATRKQAGKLIAAFVDPVFTKDDYRVSSTGSASAPRPDDGSTSKSVLRDFDADRWKPVRLENSIKEAEAIRSLCGDALIKIGFDASLTNVKGIDLSDYRIVHFATHGRINNKHPDLSKIVLSLINEHGEPQDGFLRLNDIYNLKLSADLVVLSACETALGKDIRGEGLVGLTRGFMYAGAARVMASLWKVDDERTAELMKRFYEKVFKENMQPAAALRAAQLEMWRSGNNSPYYWGGFVIQGEWKDMHAGGFR